MSYLLLYYGGSMPSTPAEQAEVLKAWQAWYAALGKAAVKDEGNPFSGKIKSVGPDGTISNAPIARPASGYSIVEAESIDAAAKMAQGCPVLKSGGQIAVFETFNAM